jgi:ABC-type bacteriocin/lantibiotic exporter with double-glycine peptidase domain
LYLLYGSIISIILYLRGGYSLIDLHYGRQAFDYDCGATALQTVMAYYGVEVRLDELMEALGTDENGTDVHNMIRTAIRYGFKVEARSGWALKEIKFMIDRGIPSIVLLQAWAEQPKTLKEWEKNYSDGHYAILIGHAKGVLLFEDPASFRRTWLREREFMARWHDRDEITAEVFDRFAMILLGREPVLRTPQYMG